MRNKLRLARRVLAVVSISGGMMGLISLSFSIPSVGGIGQSALTMLFAAMFFIGLIGGVTLLESSDAYNSYVLFFILAQTPIIHSSLVSYQFSSLVSCEIVFRSLFSSDFMWQVGSQWKASAFSTPGVSGVGVNVFPLLVLSVAHIFNRDKRHGNIGAD
jgi:hypothetical protein